MVYKLGKAVLPIPEYWDGAVILRASLFVFFSCCVAIASFAQDQSVQTGPSRVSAKELIHLGIDLSGPDKGRQLELLELKIEKIRHDIEVSLERLKVRSGGVDTGGGTIVKSTDGSGLLDLYLYAPEIFADQTGDSSNVKTTKALRILGVDLVINAQNPLVKKTEEQIKKWKNSSPVMTEHLLTALSTLPFYFHNSEIVSPPVKFFLSTAAKVHQNQLKMVALYVPEFGVHIGIQDLQRLPEKHQIALLIHETLRHLRFVGDFTFSDEILQRITADLMRGPDQVRTVDTVENLAGPRLLSIFEKVLFFESADLAIADFCRYYRAHKDRFVLPSDAPDLKCEPDPKILEFNEVSHRIRVANSYMYVQSNIAEDATLLDLFNRFELLELKARNLALSSIVGRMSYYDSYLRSRSRRMSFDSVIDQVNDSFFWTNNELVAQFKLEMNWYLAQADLRLKDRSQ